MKRSDWLLLPMALVILLIFSSLLGAQTPTPVGQCPIGFNLQTVGADAFCVRAGFSGVTPRAALRENPDVYANWMAKKSLPMTIPPMPGWWRYGNQYLPCTYTPYGTQTTANPGGGWLDPTNGLPFYARYDTAAMQFFPNHPADGTYGGQGGPNHTDQYWVGGRLDPFNPGDNPPPSWWYPAPVVAGVCPLFLSYSHNAGRTCPTDTEAHYTTLTLSNPVWIESWNAIKPQHDADCNGPQVTWTPTRTATPMQPTPTPTPSQGDPTMTVYIEAITAAGITNGCGNGKFCGTSTITRQEVAVWLAKALKLPLLPCQGIYTDAPCPTPTPVPQHILVSP